MNDLQINVTGLEDEYLIRFSIYYADEYSDGGKRVVVVEYGGNTSYYYMVNDLYDFISNVNRLENICRQDNRSSDACP